MKTPRTALLESEQSLKALTSPVRLEIVEAFEPGETCTVAELAARLARPPQALYYHVKELVRAGILLEAERRLKGRRYEAHYRRAAERIGLGARVGSAASEAAAHRLLVATLRKAGREFQAATRAGLLSALPAGSPLGRRITSWLTARDLKSLATHFEAIDAILTRARRRRQGQRFALTTLLVPVAEPESGTSGPAPPPGRSRPTVRSAGPRARRTRLSGA